MPELISGKKRKSFFCTLLYFSYNGEWSNNEKNGPGTYTWKKSGAIYDGEWKNNVRNGFGMYSLPDTAEGGFKKVYAGGWLNDKKHGHGTFYYTAAKYYEGEWCEGMRSGWGRMYYEVWKCAVNKVS